jgi:hypothetical protein
MCTTLDPPFSCLTITLKKTLHKQTTHGLRNGPVTQGYIASCRQACLQLQTTFIENYERMSNIWPHLTLRGHCGVNCSDLLTMLLSGINLSCTVLTYTVTCTVDLVWPIGTVAEQVAAPIQRDALLSPAPELVAAAQSQVSGFHSCTPETNSISYVMGLYWKSLEFHLLSSFLCPILSNTPPPAHYHCPSFI